MRGFQFVRAWALAAAIGVLWVGWAAADEISGEDRPTGLRVTGMTFVGSRGKTSEIVVRATTAYFMPDSGIADLENVRAVFSDEVKGKNFEMSCDSAELNVKTNDFTATGNVNGVTGDGQHYKTAWVHYDHESALLHTDAEVTVVDGAGRFRGDGFRYHIEERRFELLGNVSVEQVE